MVNELTIKKKIFNFARVRDEYYNTSNDLEETLNEFLDGKASEIKAFDEYIILVFDDGNLDGDVIGKTSNFNTQIRGRIMNIAVPREVE